MVDFDLDKLKKVRIEEVEENDYNPKQKDTEEYKKIKRSIELHGLRQPIICRSVNGKYIVVDGAQRFTSAKELGYKEVYVYDCGEMSDEEAKALTLWMQVQRPFEDMLLAPLVIELNDLNVEVPYSEKEVDEFKKLLDFDFVEAFEEQKEKASSDMGDLIIRMTSEQFEVARRAIDYVADTQKVSEGKALYIICGGDNEK